MIVTDPQHRYQEIEERLGVLPELFCVGTPETAATLWHFARVAYLDNPLPSLFEERLFVVLSWWSGDRYGTARHVGFLLGRGWPAGDRACPPDSIERVLALLNRPVPRGRSVDDAVATIESGGLPPLDALDPAGEAALFACAAQVYLQTTRADRCLRALAAALDAETVEHLFAFLAFVRTSRDWVRMHPEVELEDDVRELLASEPALAERIHRGADGLLPCDPDAFLEDANRRTDEFLATLAHELRNPLGPIRNGLRLIQRAAGDRETVDMAHGILERQVGHLVVLIDDLVDVSRITRGRIALHRDLVDLEVAIGHGVESVRPTIEQRGHQLEISLPPAPLVVDGDLTRLAQIVGNLVGNSAKYTPPGGVIRVAATRADDVAVLTVTDSGIGIPPAALGRIFDLFAQVDRSLEKTTGGLGIGLALVRGLVELHGGTVSAHSEGTGRGSTFTVRVPLVDTPAPMPVGEAPPEPGPPERLRVLVVDDNIDGAEALAALAKFAGSEVRTAYDGFAAVAVASEFRPDLILMDVAMPRLNGLDATRRIRAEPWGRSITIVALTGWGQDVDRDRSKQAGCDDHLVKPVDPVAIERLVARLPRAGDATPPPGRSATPS